MEQKLSITSSSSRVLTRQIEPHFDPSVNTTIFLKHHSPDRSKPGSPNDSSPVTSSSRVMTQQIEPHSDSSITTTTLLKHDSPEQSNPGFLTGSSSVTVSVSQSHSDPSQSLLSTSPVPDFQIEWVSLTIIFVVALVTESAKGLLMSSFLPAINQFGASNPAAALGTLTASYAFGRLIATLPMGFISDKFSPTSVLIGTLLVQAFGHLCYCLSPNLFLLHVARTVVGVGSTSTNLARTHIARCIPPEKRTAHYANLCALQFAGITAMPVFGSLMSSVPKFTSLVNPCTYPAYFLFVLNVVCALITHRYYTSTPYQPNSTPTSSTVTAIKSSTALSKKVIKKNYGSADRIQMKNSLATEDDSSSSPRTHAIVVCLIVNICAKSVTTVLETISVPFLCEQFSIPTTQASFYVSLLGVVGVCTFFLLQPLSHSTSDRKLLRRGLYVLCSASFLLAIPSLTRGMGVLAYVSCIGAAWSIGAPVAQTATLAMFSKALAGLPVGGFIGVFSASGALAPLGAVLTATTLWAQKGKEAVFEAILWTVMTALAIVVLMYSRLKMPGKPI